MPRWILPTLMALLLVISGSLCWACLTKGHNWGDDFAAYISQAASIVRGDIEGYIEANGFMMEQSVPGFGPTAAPWGFPLLLSPFFALFGLNMLALKTVGIVFYLLFLVLLWFSFRRIHSSEMRLILVSLFALSRFMISHTDAILSDIPFLFMSTLTVVMIGRTVVEKRWLVSRSVDLLIVGLLVAISAFVRTNGILLLATLAVAQGIALVRDWFAERRSKPGTPLPSRRGGETVLRKVLSSVGTSILPYLSFLSATLVWNSLLPEGGTSYWSYYHGFSASVFRDNVLYYIALPLEIFGNNLLGHILYAVTVVLILIGALRRVKQDYHILTYAALTMMVFLNWPYPQGLRFLFPLFPFCLSFGLTGLETIVNIARGKWARVARSLSIAVLLVPIVILAQESFTTAAANLERDRVAPIGPYTEASQEMFAFVRDHIEDDAVIVFFKPRAMYLFTGRLSVRTELTSALEFGDYICLWLAQDANSQLPLAFVGRLEDENVVEPAFENSGFRIYRILRIPEQ